MMLAESISAVADKVIEAEALNKFYELFSIFIVEHSPGITHLSTITLSVGIFVQLTSILELRQDFKSISEF